MRFNRHTIEFGANYTLQKGRALLYGGTRIQTTIDEGEGVTLPRRKDKKKEMIGSYREEANP